MTLYTKQKPHYFTFKLITLHLCLTYRHSKLTGPKEGRGGINQEDGMNRSKVLYIKYISNEDLLYSTGNYVQYLVITDNVK